MSTTHILRAVAMLSAAVCSITVAGKDNLFLDLAAPKIRARLKAQTPGCSGGRLAGADHVPLTKPELTLTLEIRSLSHTRFRAGDNITAELRLTNVGSKAILIPWSPYDRTVYGPNCEWPKLPGATGLRGMLSLDLSEATGHREFVASSGLYGISTDPDSYRSLPPHGSATFKIGGPVYDIQPSPAESEKRLTTGGERRFRITARFDLDNSSLWNPYWTIRSGNSFAVTLERN